MNGYASRILARAARGKVLARDDSSFAGGCLVASGGYVICETQSGSGPSAMRKDSLCIRLP